MLASLPSWRHFVLDALISFKLTRVKTPAKSGIDYFLLVFLPERENICHDVSCGRKLILLAASLENFLFGVGTAG